MSIIPIEAMSDWMLEGIIGLFEDNVEDMRFNDYRMELRRAAGMPIDDPYYLTIIAENKALEANTAEIEVLLRDKGVRQDAIEQYRRAGLGNGNAFIQKDRDRRAEWDSQEDHGQHGK